MSSHRVNPRSAVFVVCTLTVLLSIVHLVIAL